MTHAESDLIISLTFNNRKYQDEQKTEKVSRSKKVIRSRFKINFCIGLTISKEGISKDGDSHENVSFPLLFRINMRLHFLFPLNYSNCTKLASVNVMTPIVISIATNTFLGESFKVEPFFTRLKKTPITTTIIYLMLPPITLFKNEI